MSADAAGPGAPSSSAAPTRVRRRVLAVVLAAAALAAVPPSASSQERAGGNGRTEKSPVAAAVFELYVPLTGYAYAGDWKRGIPAAALWAGGVAALAYGAACVTDGPGEGCSEARRRAGELGWLAAAISRLWGGVGAYRTAREHHRAAGTGPNPVLVRRDDGRLGIGLRLPVPRTGGTRPR